MSVVNSHEDLYHQSSQQQQQLTTALPTSKESSSPLERRPSLFTQRIKKLTKSKSYLNFHQYLDTNKSHSSLDSTTSSSTEDHKQQSPVSQSTSQMLFKKLTRNPTKKDVDQNQQQQQH